jgi:hypothetical protein
MITLSLTIWCQGLLVSFREKAEQWGRELKRLKRRAEPEAELAELMEYLEILGQDSTASGRDRQLRRLVASALSAVQLAEELRSSLRLAPPRDLFSQALAREIYAMALSATLTACHYLNTRHGHTPSEETVQAIDEAFSRVGQTLSFAFPEIRNAGVLFSYDLNKKVDDLLKLCILVWDTFGAEH